MIKSLAFAGLALSSSITYAACPEGNTTTLCFDPVDSNLSKILTQKEQVINMNGDGVLDKVYVDETTKEVAIKLGKACSAGSDDICFEQPFYTGILNNKGFLADDLTGNGIPELTVRTDQDVIKVYNQPGFGQGKDDGYRIGDPEYISILGTNGLTEASYSASSVVPDGFYPSNKDGTIQGAFDGYLRFHVNRVLSDFALSPLAVARHGANSHWVNNPSDSEYLGGDWLQIEFNSPVSVSSTELHAVSIIGAVKPKTVSILYSNDGISFDTHHTEMAPIENIAPHNYLVSKTTPPKPTPFAKYIRIFIHDGHPKGIRGGMGIGVSELLLKGWIKPSE